MLGKLLLFVAGSSAALAIAAQPAPGSYPIRPIRIVVPQSPGGASDLNARVVSPPLSDRLGQPIVVDNRAGAGSLIGTDLVAKAVPDGYTLLAISSSFTIVPSMFKSVPYNAARDFTAVALLSSYPHLVVVHPAVPANSIKELIALAKAKPKSLNYASAGIGTPTQLGVELFKSLAGVDIVHVAYNGGGPAITALLGGQVQVYFGPFPTVLPHVKSGKLRALGVTSLKHSSILPDLPSVAEAGVPGFEQNAWNGLLAPTKTPPAVIKKLNSELEAVLQSRPVRERFASEGAEAGGMSAEQFDAMVKTELTKWAKVIKQAGIQPE